MSERGPTSSSSSSSVFSHYYYIYICVNRQIDRQRYTTNTPAPDKEFLSDLPTSFTGILHQKISLLFCIAMQKLAYLSDSFVMNLFVLCIFLQLLTVLSSGYFTQCPYLRSGVVYYWTSCISGVSLTGSNLWVMKIRQCVSDSS